MNKYSLSTTVTRPCTFCLINIHDKIRVDMADQTPRPTSTVNFAYSASSGIARQIIGF